MKTLTISKQAPGLFDYVNRMAELQEHSLSPWIDWIKSSIGRNFIRPWKKLSKARPRYEVVMMFKILVLQRYYNLSEEQTEYQIKDRLSFQKFLGLTLADAVADKNTIEDFKQRLIEAGMMEKLFERFKGHLDVPAR